MVGASPHASVALGRSNVQTVPHSTLLGPTQVMAGGGPHTSVALGRSKDQTVPPSIVLGPTQVMAGGVVSTTVTVWLQVLLLPQASVALQVRVAAKPFPQVAFVVVPTMAIAGVG